MLKTLAVLLTDQKSKYGTYFSIPAMEDMVFKGMKGVPMHLGHDMHRPIGVMKALGIYFEPNQVRNIGIGLIPENNQDVKEVLSFKANDYISQITEHVGENQNRLYNEIAENIEGEFNYMHCGTLSVINKEIVKRVFPELETFSDKDKNGLINISDLLVDFEYKYQGIFTHKKLPLCIYCHQYFRRSLSRANNFHYFFLDELFSHKSNKDITIKIALDWDMIGYAPDVLESMEFEYWFGPKYNDDISQISNGLTKHSTDEFERNYYGISTTEFFWKSNDDLKEFELEELRENQSPTEGDFYGCRYVHSIFNTSKSTFIHFDGAIRGYDSDLYFQRLDNNMTEFGRGSQYTKIFRIDGKLELNIWKSLVTSYMQDNPLIYEYFGESKPVSTIQDNSNEESKSLKDILVPNRMDKDDGLKFLLSYHEKSTDYQNNSHAVSIYDCMTINGEKVDVIEDEIIELKKYLKSNGKSLFIKPETLFVNCKDEYWNIPSIFHGSENTRDNINLTISGLKLIFTRLMERKLNTIVSFTISWNDTDKLNQLSCVGHIENLYNWLNSFEELPLQREELRLWLEMQRTYLNTKFNSITNKPRLQNICQFDGILYIKRKMVSEEFNLVPFVEDNAMKYQMVIPDDQNKYEDVINQTIRPTMFYVNKSPECNICNENYFNCTHSKLFDKDCFVTISKWDGLLFYWTDKIII